MIGPKAKRECDFLLYMSGVWGHALLKFFNTKYAFVVQ